MKNEFSLNDYVLLVYDKRRRWLKKIVNEDFHCNYGFFNLINLVGMKHGYSVTTNKGIPLMALTPAIRDWIDAFKHESQVIYAKDAAAIILLLDIKPDDTVYEAGTGSGALTAILSRFVGSLGKIITHEKRAQAQNIAIQNLNNMGISNVEHHKRDVIEEGLIPGRADSVIFDLADPWNIIGNVTSILKPSGRIVIFLPTYNQIEKTILSLEEFNFREINAIELIEREIQLKKGAIRPATRNVGHTGFLISGIYLGEKI